MDPEEVASLISPSTKMIVINSPSRSHQAVAAKKRFRFYKLAERHDLFLLSDEIYARMIYYSDVGFSRLVNTMSVPCIIVNSLVVLCDDG